MGEGKSLAEDVSDEEVKAKGSGFRKQANRYASKYAFTISTLIQDGDAVKGLEKNGP